MKTCSWSWLPVRLRPPSRVNERTPPQSQRLAAHPNSMARAAARLLPLFLPWRRPPPVRLLRRRLLPTPSSTRTLAARPDTLVLPGDERSPTPARLPPHQTRQDYDGEAGAALPGPSRPSSPPSEADRGRSGSCGSRAPTPSPSSAACSGPPGGHRRKSRVRGRRAATSWSTDSRSTRTAASSMR